MSRVNRQVLLVHWLEEGSVRNVEYRRDGIENAGLACSRLLEGKYLAKTLVASWPRRPPSDRRRCPA